MSRRLEISLLVEGKMTMADPKPVCDLCDAHREDSSGNFRVMPPVFRSFGGRRRFSGSIATVRCFENNTLVKAALNEPGGGRVLVVDGGASLRRALVGGNLGAGAVRQGWAGILVNGCVRDVDELLPLPLGILALACMPMPPRKLGEGERDVPVLVQGHWVRAGEWLYADEDGVVVSSTALA
jgi:regulator of ribonuclease activity A